VGILLVGGNQTVLCCFFASRMAPQERQTATPCLIFSAQTGNRLAAGIVEPGLLKSELAGGATLEVSDEHGVLGALPFEIGGSDQAALEFLKGGGALRQVRSP